MKIGKLKSYRKILILGYGREGQATEKFLHVHHRQAKVLIADQHDGSGYLDRQYEAELVIKTPGIPKHLVKVPYSTATNIFFANFEGRAIGVTGSKGKSTTASLIHAILIEAGLKSHLAGNIGTPLLTKLTSSNSADDIFVCELSSYQLDDIAYSPHIAVFLNIFPDHMPYHGDFDAYFKAKSRIVKFSTAQDYFVYNPKFRLLVDLAAQTKSQAIPFVEKLGFDIDGVELIGSHNQDNIRAAATVASILGVSPRIVERAIFGFKPLPHRLQVVGKYRNITFIDDAASTTPESTIAALETLPDVETIFLGGEDRGYDFSDLAGMIREKQIKNIVLFPDSGGAILKALKKNTGKLPRILETDDMKRAVQWALEVGAAGTVCLLSTASPSYSLWKNFKEKGALFQRWVKELGRA